MAEEIKIKILEFLKLNAGQKFSATSIEKNLPYSYPTILKWIDVLKAENLIFVEDYGNIKLISYKGE